MRRAWINTVNLECTREPDVNSSENSEVSESSGGCNFIRTNRTGDTEHEVRSILLPVTPALVQT